MKLISRMLGESIPIFKPSDPPCFKDLMEDYVNRCTALGGPLDMFEGDIAGDPFSVVRIIGYPAVNRKQMPDAINDIGCGEHTDYGLLTLVNQDDDITALQVRNIVGEWIPAAPVPGTFVCNIGDTLKARTHIQHARARTRTRTRTRTRILTNGIYESTLHRVMNNSAKYRTNYDAAVEPLEICVERSGGAKKIDGAVVYGKHLMVIPN
ncbi:hypothetical protein SASPL_115129 [Salvia splendens]|uniref:Fe2OG dioxygenase domain-containing protein n=1 Tax=Salvia splendens TaxID=180675 RepID=A0A8X9A2R0_SALSN|nr:hypothetical protein SASPL_115129 [Salvia splendens]